MRVLYITSLAMDSQKSGGAKEHVMEMVNGLEKDGFEINLLSPPEFKFGIVSAIERKCLMAKLTKARVIEFNPDIIYFRYSAGDILSIQQIVRHKRPYVLELNTKTIPELRSTHRFFPFIICMLSEPWLFRNASGLAALTPEIYRYALNLGKKEKPFLLARNGVDINSFLFHGYNPSLRQTYDTPMQAPLLAMIGSLSPWHGVDILLQCLETPDLQNYYLWLIGNVPINKIKEIASERVLQRIRIIPWQPPADLSYTLSAADLGVSSLALYRNDMQEAQPLKTRAYLACGLPAFLGYNDPVINNNHPFCAYSRNLRTIDLSCDIKYFYSSIKANRSSLGKQAREFAEKNLSWDIAVKETADFLREIYAQGNFLTA